MTVGALTEVTGDLWCWTARHPQWHPGEWGAEVASYVLAAPGALLLVDPLLPEREPDQVADAVDELAAGREVHVLVTVGYHARSADAVADRFGALIWGPPSVARRLRDPQRLTVLEPGEPGPAGAVAHRIGKPIRGERPLWLPTHAALAFGDAVVANPDGELRLWTHEPVDEKCERFHRERLAPTLAPLLDHPVEHVLTTHGEPTIGGGARALRAALSAPPWYHRA